MNKIAEFIKQNRKANGLTQEEFAIRSGLGLRFVRELEQGKETVRMDKVNVALSMFGMEAVPGRKIMEILRTAYVYVRNVYAGELCETDDGYLFSYDSDYIESYGASAVSLTMPLYKQTYTSKTLFPFFDGLIPEGWMLQVVSRNWKINIQDRFGLLIVSCKDCIGNVSIKEVKE